MKIHSEKEQECDKCNFTCITTKNLRVHQKIHKIVQKAEGQYTSCSMCPKKYKSSNGLIQHNERIHLINGNSQRFKCNNCKFAFPHMSQLKQHKKEVHANQRDMVCKICKKGFKRKYHLKVHMRLHTGKRGNSMRLLW